MPLREWVIDVSVAQRQPRRAKLGPARRVHRAAAGRAVRSAALGHLRSKTARTTRRVFGWRRYRATCESRKRKVLLRYLRPLTTPKIKPETVFLHCCGVRDWPALSGMPRAGRLSRVGSRATVTGRYAGDSSCLLPHPSRCPMPSTDKLRCSGGDGNGVREALANCAPSSGRWIRRHSRAGRVNRRRRSVAAREHVCGDRSESTFAADDDLRDLDFRPRRGRGSSPRKAPKRAPIS